MVLSEIMADPNPPVGWDSEYVELYNRSDTAVDLRGWTLKAGSRKVLLGEPGHTDSLAAGSYLSIALTSLPNSGGEVLLLDALGRLIHAVAYRVPAGAPRWKEEGGWSLEAPDPDCVCTSSEFWVYSCDPSGGSPGLPNCQSFSVEDASSPDYLYHGWDSRGRLYLQFSESLDYDLGQIIEGSGELGGNSIRIRPGGLIPLMVNVDFPFRERLYLVLPELCLDHDRLRIHLPALGDCQGNWSVPMDILCGTAASPAGGSVLLSEIMYDPREGKSEFVEIYNPGPHFIDLQDLALGVAEPGELPSDFMALSEESRILNPMQYAVLCRRSDELKLGYGVEGGGQLVEDGQQVEVERLPLLSDGGGELFLSDRAGNSVDRAVYGDEMHMELLGEHRGISLERMDFGQTGMDPQNWHSAASTSGYATPGGPNSQLLAGRSGGVKLSLQSRVFSPDNDGWEDLLEISLGSTEPGTLIRLWISDARGLPLKMLADEVLVGDDARFYWDGRDGQGYLQQQGYYVVHLHCMHPQSGKQSRISRACGLIFP